jgi:hypothetical protein
MSSNGWSKSFAQEGIFGTDLATNPFANANKIFVKVRAARSACSVCSAQRACASCAPPECSFSAPRASR